MAGRYIKDEVIDVTARSVAPEEPETPQYEASQYKPTGIFARFFRRLFLSALWTSVGFAIAFGRSAYTISEITGRPFMWEFGYQIGIQDTWFLVTIYVLAWIIYPYLDR